MPKLMNIQMELRKCCNHPFLINGVEQNEMVNKYLRLFYSCVCFDHFCVLLLFCATGLPHTFTVSVLPISRLLQSVLQIQ